MGRALKLPVFPIPLLVIMPVLAGLATVGAVWSSVRYPAEGLRHVLLVADVVVSALVIIPTLRLVHTIEVAADGIQLRSVLGTATLSPARPSMVVVAEHPFIHALSEGSPTRGAVERHERKRVVRIELDDVQLDRRGRCPWLVAIPHDFRGRVDRLALTLMARDQHVAARWCEALLRLHPGVAVTHAPMMIVSSATPKIPVWLPPDPRHRSFPEVMGICLLVTAAVTIWLFSGAAPAL